MPGSLQDALKQAYATADSSVVVLDTLEIINPSVETLYLVADTAPEGHDLRLENGVWKHFQSAAFRFIPPAAGDDGTQDLNLAFDNVGLVVTEYVKQALVSRKAVTLKYRPYLASDKATPQMNPALTLQITDVQITVSEVTCRASYAELLNRKFLSERFTRRRFPTLGS